MPRRIAVTKGELAALEELQHTLLGVATPKQAKAYHSLLAKAKDSHTAINPAGLSFAAFHKILSEVLGRRLALPPNPSPAWYAIQTNKIRATGINEEQARLVAIGAKTVRFPTIAFDMITARLTSFLAQGQQVEERKGNAGRETPTGFGREED